MVEQNEILSAALSYARQGIAVFPCRGKRPTTPNGFHDATTSLTVIREWFTKMDEPLNVAAAIPSWAVVLDVDGQDGLDNLKAHGFVPPGTSTVKTPRGWHYWYIWRGESAPTRKVGFLPHVDLLTNGYVLVPPSTGYSWEEDAGLSESAIEMAPEWLGTTIQESKSERDRIDPDDWFMGLPEGQRQTGLFRYACRLRRNPRTSKTEAKVLLAELARRSEGNGYRQYPDTDALVERVWKTYDAEIGESESVRETHKALSLAELLATTHEPPSYLVDKLLPGIGYSILFAAQGAGKSVLADQVAISVATGGKFLNRQCKHCGVLVLDIEQDPYGAAERWRKLMNGLGLNEPPANLYTAFEWPALDDGGFKQLADFLVDHSHVRLVVVDTLAQATEMSDDGGGNAYFQDSRAMGKFTRFAREYGISFLIVSHTRKANAGSPDSFADACSGSRGITGPAKARWWLQRKEGQESGKLWIGGKVPESQLSITFDRDFLLWR